MRKPGMLLAAMIAATAQGAITVSPQEMAQKQAWVQQNLLTANNLPPFSFTFGGQPSSLWLPSGGRAETDTVLDTNRTQHAITWTKNGLQVSCVAVEFNDYPMVEWTVYLANIGTNATPILQGLQGLNTTFSRPSGPEFVLNGIQGDSATTSSYEPYQITLNPSSLNSFSPPSYSGKSCDTAWPYYNLQTAGGGVILAIGWPGQWACSFTRDTTTNLTIKAGQQLTSLYLNPGEVIRTPLIGLFFWQGTNVVRAQNLWRHWYLAHEIPRVNGQPPSPFVAVGGDSTNDVEAYLQADLHPDVLWRDADTKPYAWYPTSGGSWVNTGTWEVDTNYYPHGFLGTSQVIQALGMKFLLWFEPERVGNPNSWLATEHAAWLLPGTGTTAGAILDEANPAVFNWLTNHFQSLIVSNGIGWYREDMNGSGPLPAWQNNDATNRQGITENFYVQNHLAYWDALLAMNPGLRIDCCGSGGRRNDLEAMRRAVPLWRSDFSPGDLSTLADGNQCLTYGLSFWLPFQGTSSHGLWDPYSFRSCYLAEFSTGGINGLNSAAQQQAVTEVKKIGPLILNGDYYPLTPYSQSDTVWMAWQFDRPETMEGCAQIFRRTNSPVEAMTVQLQGLNPAQAYDVQDFDRGDLGVLTGTELMSIGVMLQLSPRQSAILYYTNACPVILSISASNGGLIISWPTNVAAGAVLQSSPDLVAWRETTATPLVCGANWIVRVTPSSAQDFFRLAFLRASDVTVGSSAQTAVQGSSVTFTATLAFQTTGNVTFLTNGGVLSVNPIMNGVAQSNPTRDLPVGTNSITAEFAGNDSLLGSTNSLPGGEIVVPLAMNFSVQPPIAVFGQTVVFTATLPVDATGNVSFFTNGVLWLTTPIINGVAVSSTAFLPRGNTTIAAEYTGNGYYLGATSSLGFEVASEMTYSMKTNFWWIAADGWPQITNQYADASGATSQNTWDYGYSYSTNADFDLATNNPLWGTNLSMAAVQFIPMTNTDIYPSVPVYAWSDPSGTVLIGWEAYQWFLTAPPSETVNAFGGPLGPFMFCASGSGPTDGANGYGAEGPNDGILAIIRWTAPSDGTAVVQGDFDCSDNYGDESFGLVRYGGAVGDEFVVPRGITSWSNLDFNGLATGKNYPRDITFSTNLTVVAGEKLAFIQGNGTDGYWYNTGGMEATVAFTAAATQPPPTIPTITIQAQPSSACLGQQVSFIATLPQDAIGVVSFFTNGALWTAVPLFKGVATSSTSLLPRGNNTITAEYAGGGDYLGATNSLGFEVASEMTYSMKTNFWWIAADGWPQITNQYADASGATIQNTWDYGYSYSTNANFDVVTNNPSWGTNPSMAAVQFIPMANTDIYPSVPYYGWSDPSGTVRIGWEAYQWYLTAPPSETVNIYGGPLGPFMFCASGAGPTDGANGYGAEGPNDGILAIIRWTAPNDGTAVVQGDFDCSDNYGDESFGLVRYGGAEGNQFVVARGITSWSNLDFNGLATGKNYPRDITFSTNLTVIAGEKLAFIQGNGTDGYWYNTGGMEATIAFTAAAAQPALAIAPGPFEVFPPLVLPNGSLQITFTNVPGTSFTVLAATNLALPLSQWTVLGSASETSRGKFQFNDTMTPANRCRFYRMTSP
jgi:alpha-galactosidase